MAQGCASLERNVQRLWLRVWGRRRVSGASVLLQGVEWGSGLPKLPGTRKQAAGKGSGLGTPSTRGQEGRDMWGQVGGFPEHLWWDMLSSSRTSTAWDIRWTRPQPRPPSGSE